MTEDEMELAERCHTDSCDHEAVLRAALVALTDTLGSVEFRANVFGLTCTQEDASRLAVAVDTAHAALREPDVTDSAGDK